MCLSLNMKLGYGGIRQSSIYTLRGKGCHSNYSRAYSSNADILSPKGRETGVPGRFMLDLISIDNLHTKQQEGGSVVRCTGYTCIKQTS